MRHLRPLPASWLLAGLLVLATALSMSAHAQPATPAALPSVELPPELDAVLRGYERAFRAKDAQALTALFTEDGFALPEGRPPVRGREGLRQAFAQVGGPLSLRALAYRQQGDLATVIGAYRFSDEGGGRDDGKFVLTLLREGGTWRIFSDIDNASAPPRPAQARQP